MDSEAPEVTNICTDCGHDCERPPKESPVLDTIRAVGHIAQVQNNDGVWLSWTMYAAGSPGENRQNARTLVERLLANERYNFTRGRVIRDDWVVEELIRPPQIREGWGKRTARIVASKQRRSERE